MATMKIQTGLRLEEGLYYKLKVLAEKEGRSINNLAEYIIRCYVADYEAAKGEIPVSLDQ